MSGPFAASLDDVRAAARRIEPHAHRTPVLTSSTLDALAGRRLYFKCENFQRVGAFKFRGATNAVRKLTDAAATKGVVTHSSGNHAQAVALAARLRGIPAHVVMPSNAPAVKRRAVEGYGARVIECSPTLAAREAAAAEAVAETGAVFLPPYDHADVIAGQGTAALELVEEVGELDAVVTPVGGGGLVSGTCAAVHGLLPKALVVGAEPAGADDAARSKAAGKLLPQTGPRTVADGLLTSLGELTWPFVRDRVESVITVTDEEILAAMRLVWERMKIVVEPSAATAVAAALADGFRSVGGPGGPARVGVILSGGNVDLDRLPWAR